MKHSYKINMNCSNLQIRASRIIIKPLNNNGFTIGLVLINSIKLLKSLMMSYLYTYICGNCTHSASRKISKWVFFFLGHSITNNTPPLPHIEAHFGGFFFFGKSFSLTQSTNS